MSIARPSSGAEPVSASLIAGGNVRSHITVPVPATSPSHGGRFDELFVPMVDALRRAGALVTVDPPRLR